MERHTFDVYGRWQAIAERDESGAWRLYRRGVDGKRSRIIDVVVPDGAAVDEVIDQLEATFHEHATPGTAIRRL